MLSKTRKNSPTRLAAGLVGVSAVGLAALGLTASGTQAAERIKNKVEAVTGVSLGQDVPAPPAAPEAPALPDKPEKPAKVERHVYSYSEDGKGKDGKKVKRIVIVHANGDKEEIAMPEMPPMPPMPPMPEVRNLNCGGGDKPVVEHKTERGKQVVIVCSDRMAKVTVDAERMAMRSKKFGMGAAAMGLRHARAAIEMQSDLSAEQRAKALKGIDEAIAEIEKDAASDD